MTVWSDTTGLGASGGAHAVVKDATLAYWSELGWPVRCTRDAVLLTVTDDLRAVSLPRSAGAPLLEHLWRTGSAGAVLGFASAVADQWLFFAERPAAGLDRARETRFDLRPGTAVPLPPSATPQGLLRWVHAPAETPTPLLDDATLIAGLVTTGLLRETSAPGGWIARGLGRIARPRGGPRG
jgi:hypothetical protein